MKNITLAIEDDVLDRARDYASRHGTTVNAIVREHLASITEQESRRDAARKRLLELIDSSTARLGPGYKWNREELYEERMLPRHKRTGIRSRRKAG